MGHMDILSFWNLTVLGLLNCHYIERNVQDIGPLENVHFKESKSSVSKDASNTPLVFFGHLYIYIYIYIYIYNYGILTSS